jgi:uncharacterized protein (TIGR02391 family)
MDTDWAAKKLRRYLEVSLLGTRAAVDETHQLEPIVRRIANVVVPGLGDREIDNFGRPIWPYARDHTLEVLGLVEHEQELREHLYSGPELRASSLHEGVWGAAQSLWATDHRRDAVSAAARYVNAMLQAKLGRRDLVDSKLAEQAFSLHDPGADKPRLRFPGVPRNESWRSRQQGAMHFAVGCFQAIRNVLAHEADIELTEAEALEQLAAFSLLARWVDACEIERE